MNWQVNRTTPVVLITHKRQRAWHSKHQHIPGISPRQVSVLRPSGPQALEVLILCDVQDDPQT